MKKFRPSATYEGFERSGSNPSVEVQSPTYTKLKKELPNLLRKSRENLVTVIRWKNNGEYFEKWRFEEGKARIVRQGFM